MINKGSVILTFDDGHESIWSVARPALSKLGVSATAFVCGGLSETSGYMSIDYLKRLRHDYGWDIYNHTFDHIKLTTISEVDAEKQVSKNIEWLSASGIIDEYDTGVFCYPWGRADSTSEAIVGKYHKYARACMGHMYGGEQKTRTIEPLPFTHPLLITARPFSSESGIEDARKLIDQVVGTSRALVFYMHKCGAVADRLTVAVDELIAAVEYALTKGCLVGSFSMLLGLLK